MLPSAYVKEPLCVCVYVCVCVRVQEFQSRPFEMYQKKKKSVSTLTWDPISCLTSLLNKVRGRLSHSTFPFIQVKPSPPALVVGHDLSCSLWIEKVDS